MSSKQVPCEEINLMEFQDLYASPAKSEASSVDIYDGLDVSNVTEEIAKQPSPPRDCLDLYEEILTEEGNAKETTFNQLSADYEKSQKQMKQLLKKLKEMECLNTNLQNENQCLKKNISALIKTARVEITRKEEEIKRLSQRFSSTGNTRSVPPPLLNINAKLKYQDFPKDARNKENDVRKGVKPQEVSSKDSMCTYSSPKNPEFSNGTRIKEANLRKEVNPQVSKDSTCTYSSPKNPEFSKGSIIKESNLRKEIKPQEVSTDSPFTYSSPKNPEFSKGSIIKESNLRKEIKPQEVSTDSPCTYSSPKNPEFSKGSIIKESNLRKEIKPQEVSTDSPCTYSSPKNPEFSKGSIIKESNLRKEVKPQEVSTDLPCTYSSPKNPEFSKGTRIKEANLGKEVKPQEVSTDSPCTYSSPKNLEFSKGTRIKEANLRKEVNPQVSKDSTCTYFSPRNLEFPQGAIIKEATDIKVKQQESTHQDRTCTYSSRKSQEPSKGVRNKENSIRKDMVPLEVSLPQNKHHKDTKSFTRNAAESSPKIPNVRQCKDVIDVQKQTSKHMPETDKIKKTTDLDSRTRETDRRRRNEGHRSSIGSANNICSSEVKEKSYEQLTKSERSQKEMKVDKNSKPDSNSKTDCRKYGSSSHDKQTSLKQAKVQHRSEEKYVKTKDRSLHKKEHKGHEWEKTVERKQLTLEKDEELANLRTHSSNPKKESSHKPFPSDPIDGKRKIDSETRGKPFEYDSKNGNKASKDSKNGDGASGITKYNSESKSSLDRENRSEKHKSKAQEKSRSDQKHKGPMQEEEKCKKQTSSKDKMHDPLRKAEQKSQNSEKSLPAQRRKSSEKDLKLSFMETLNLTLSPMKNSSQAEDLIISTMASSSETDLNNVNTEEMSSKECVSTKSEIEIQELANNLKPNDMLHNEPVSLENGANQMLSEHSKLVSLLEPTEDCVRLKKEQSAKTCDKDTALPEPLLSAANCLQLEVDEPIAVSCDDMETQSIGNDSDVIVLDSFIEIDRCSGSESASENNSNVQAENPQDEGKILAQKSEQTILETTTGICESTNTDQCLHDESSVMSIDLHFIRLIPNVVSPLKSPAKPLAHLHTTELTANASLVSLVNEGLQLDPNTRISSELNKENCEPVCRTDANSEAFQTEVFCDEVEEGEIVSDVDLECEQLVQSKGSPVQKEPAKDTKSKSPESKESKTATWSKSNAPSSPLQQPTVKSKKTKDHGKAKFLALPPFKRKNLNASSCLDGILKIVPPSSIQDVLQMLRIIRKHIRKKYMKFKIQFPITQFHRFIEAATLYFTTLVTSLDWSSLCSSSDKLQNKLCKLIDSRIRPIRKNGIVDRIFEQRLIDMKKRLWKFVEEQLDSLVDAFKGIVLTLCDKATCERGLDEKKVSITSSTKKKKSQKILKKFKVGMAKPRTEYSLKTLDFRRQTDVNLKPQSADASRRNNVKDDSTHQNVSAACHTTTRESKDSVLSVAKPQHFTECQKEPSSSGLSFNLVSDDHMGDVFKSLLHDSDNTEPNAIHENVWLLDTPEKQGTPRKQLDNVEFLPEIKTPIKEDFSWHPISPSCVATISRIDTILNPDVLDESCLLEVPANLSSSIGVAPSEDKFKSYSVLMDDLAVSLTVPSPLKSDSHLSFLRPVVEPESVTQVNMHFSEDALLDEEDATEQDIHLTLDSDNSNSGSLENATDPDGFRCHPSEPMQAVIMEKSNDHFIVKIRRAVSTGSPLSDSSSVGESVDATKDILESTHLNHDEKLQEVVSHDVRPKDASVGLLIDYIKADGEALNISKIEGKCINADPLLCSPLKTMQSILVSPEVVNLSLMDPFDSCIDSKPEHNQDCKSFVSTFAGEVLTDCGNITTACTEITENRAPSDGVDGIMESSSQDASLDLNRSKRKINFSIEEGTSSKRRCATSVHGAGGKSKSPKRRNEDKPEHLSNNLPCKQPKRAASESIVNTSSKRSSKSSPSGGISAKNVIKKKGEVVVSWTRNEDREILLECQKRSPTEKTFIALALKMHKDPGEVEERFRQLMKLFKKSKVNTS